MNDWEKRREKTEGGKRWEGKLKKREGKVYEKAKGWEMKRRKKRKGERKWESKRMETEKRKVYV